MLFRSLTLASVEAAVLEVREQHPAWGGRKIAAVLKRRGLKAPSPSTITGILRRHDVPLGMFGGGAEPFIRFEHAHPNDLWQMDFKGHVPLRSGRLHPLTVLDDHSRFSVVLAACADERTDTVRTCLTEAFRCYGLPWRMTMDNGSPWGNGPRDPFTPLGVWLIEQDIRIGHSRPYHPQTQGKDERFHCTLKTELLARQGFASMDSAQAAFDRWRDRYNLIRPHEALAQQPPVSRYQPSPRPFPEILPPIDYDAGDEVRKVQGKGEISFRGSEYLVGRGLSGLPVALRRSEEQEGAWDIYFCRQRLTRIRIGG